MSVIDHLTTILDSANIGVWHLHVPSGKVVRNEVLLRLSRASPEESDKDWWAWTERIHPSDRREVVDKGQRMLAGQLDSYSVDYRIRGIRGEWVSLRTRSMVTERDGVGRPIWLSSVLFDISRERELERRLQAISDRPFQFIGLLSTEGVLLEANQGFLRKSGCELEELIGKPFWEDSLLGHEPALQAQMKDGIVRAARGELVRFELCNKSETEGTRTLDFTLTPLRDDDGDIVNIVPEGRDITELATAREALRAAEQRLHTATEAANVGLWEWDVDPDEMWFSDQACRLLQRQPATGPSHSKGWRAIVHPADLPRINPEIVKYLKGQVAEYRIEFRMRRGDDSWGWFLSKARATDRGMDGRVKRLAGVLMDITTQHVVAERLALATEGANIGHWDTNVPTGRMWVSDQWGSMLGYSTEELPTTIRAVLGLLHPGDRPRVVQSLIEFQAQARAGSFDSEFRMRAKDGSWRWIHAKGRSVEVAPDGGSIRQTGVTMDVTDRKEAELRLSTAERLEALGRLAAGVAHEINTPIQYVSDSIHFIHEGLQELLRYGTNSRPADGSLVADPDLPYWREHLPAAVDRAVDGLARVAEIVRSMNVLTHADHAEMRPVDLTRAIQSTLVVAKNEYKHVADVDTDLADLPSITCHGSQINQVILNLVVNAAHAIADRVKDTEERGLITISTCQNGGEAVICVTDTGTGIPEAIRDRIFEPFFSTKEVGRGTGQGLSIVRNVVHAHGGSITFQTQLNRGTTFSVRLPIDHPRQNTAVEAA
jgi:two-component system, NtrC family, sensor kinase